MDLDTALYVLGRAIWKPPGSRELGGELPMSEQWGHYLHLNNQKLILQMLASWINVKHFILFCFHSKLFFFFFFFFFFLPCPCHVEVPGPGIEPEPQQWLKPQQWQCWVLNHKATRELLNNHLSKTYVVSGIAPGFWDRAMNETVKSWIQGVILGREIISHQGSRNIF